MNCISKNNRKVRCRNKAHLKYLFHCHVHKPSSVRIIWTTIFTVIPSLLAFYAFFQNNNYSERLKALEQYVSNYSIENAHDENNTNYTLEQLKIIANEVIKKSDEAIDRGNAYFTLGLLDKALVEYNNAIAKNKFNAIAYLNRANLNVRKFYRFNKEGALFFNSPLPSISTNFNQNIIINNILNDYEKAIELDSNIKNAYYHKGIIKRNLGEYNESILALNKAINLDQKDADFYNGRGVAYSDWAFSTGQPKYYTKATQDFLSAINLRPNYYLFHLNLALVYSRTEDYTKDLLSYTKAITLNPKSKEAYFNRGATYKILNKYNEAISDFNMVIEIDDNFELAYFHIGDCYLKLEQKQKAFDTFKTLINMNPKYPGMLGLIGDRMLALGKIEDAKKLYGEELKKNRNNNSVKNALEKINFSLNKK